MEHMIMNNLPLCQSMVLYIPSTGTAIQGDLKLFLSVLMLSVLQAWVFF